MRDLLVLIDRYDLYGRIAYPKTHRPEDVPALYAHARVRGGLFVNRAEAFKFARRENGNRPELVVDVPGAFELAFAGRVFGVPALAA